VLLMIWLQITANTGPAECCLAVQKALKRLLQEASEAKVEVSLIEEIPGPVAGTLRSVFLGLQSTDAHKPEAAEQLARCWSGSLLWVCQSPYRPLHRRKNWLLGGAIYSAPAPVPDSDIRYEATRASGPGGQHVNKTDSAVRATHIATGLSVKVQSERSQHANKRLAGQLLAAKLAALGKAAEDEGKAERRLQHHQSERGNAARVFAGMDFREQLSR
jgi:peptide chain release factor